MGEVGERARGREENENGTEGEESSLAAGPFSGGTVRPVPADGDVIGGGAAYCLVRIERDSIYRRNGCE